VERRVVPLILVAAGVALAQGAGGLAVVATGGRRCGASQGLHFVTKSAMAKKRLRCYLRSHRWVQKVQAGLTYYECRDCGKYRDPIQTGLPILW
jgi:hypothetical protein